jgi:hypothetical protein
MSQLINIRQNIMELDERQFSSYLLDFSMIE